MRPVRRGLSVFLSPPPPSQHPILAKQLNHGGRTKFPSSKEKKRPDRARTRTALLRCGNVAHIVLVSNIATDLKNKIGCTHRDIGIIALHRPTSASSSRT